MRELKFRAWSNEHNRYCDLVKMDEDDRWYGYIYTCAIYLTTKDIVLEQYTGLKDKNGREIYEGDIVDYVGECTCVIQYEDEGARFIHRDISDDFPFGFNGLEEYNGKLFEVIGNIHENPELLKGGEEWKFLNGIK